MWQVQVERIVRDAETNPGCSPAETAEQRQKETDRKFVPALNVLFVLCKLTTRLGHLN